MAWADFSLSEIFVMSCVSADDKKVVERDFSYRNLLITPFVWSHVLFYYLLFYFVFFCFNIQNKSPPSSVFENVVTQFFCDDPYMFCG